MRYDNEFDFHESINIESFFDEDDVLEEGMFDKLIEKRKEKKARKEEEKERKRLEAEAEAARKKEERELKKAAMKTAALNKYPIFNPSDEDIAIGDLEELVGNIKYIISKEIPGVSFINKKMGHNVTQLDEGHVLHKYTVKIFEMDDKNLKKFISNSESKLLKSKSFMKDVSQNARKYGMLDKTGTANSIGFVADVASADLDNLIDEDFVGRIKAPIINMGFTYHRNNFVKDKDGMTYLNVKMEDRYFDYAIVASIRFITRPEDVVEEDESMKESIEVLEEGLFGNKYKKKSNEELEKEVEQLRDRIMKTQKPIEIKKMYKEIKKIENELGSRENKIKKEEKKTGVYKGTIYEGNKIKSDLSKILKEVEKMLKNEAGIKEFNDNGLEICKGDDVYQLCGDDHSEFHGGTDEFCIVRIDLWDYKGGNPREIMNDSDDGWHPVNHAEEKLRLKLEKFLKEKFPHFYVCDYGGDWDTGGIEIGLRR